MTSSHKLTNRQFEIMTYIQSESLRKGRGLGYREIAEKFNIAVNAVTGHVKAFTKPGEYIREDGTPINPRDYVTWDENEKGNAKANSLRAANMAVQSGSPNCRSGNGFSVVVVGDDVAFTIFSEAGILRHDRISLNVAIGYCDTFKIPATGSAIDRIAMLAERQAVKAAKMTAS